METSELESEVRTALVGNAELMDALPLREKAIFHYVSPAVEPSRYPIIVYSPISDVPALRGDNREIAHRVTIRLHVIATQKKYAAEERNFQTACKLVNQLMTSLDFVRRQTTPYREEGKIMMIFDYVKGV